MAEDAATICYSPFICLFFHALLRYCYGYHLRTTSKSEAYQRATIEAAAAASPRPLLAYFVS